MSVDAARERLSEARIALGRAHSDGDRTAIARAEAAVARAEAALVTAEAAD